MQIQSELRAVKLCVAAQTHSQSTPETYFTDCVALDVGNMR